MSKWPAKAAYGQKPTVIEEDKKSEYLGFARAMSYAMQGRSLKQSLSAGIHDVLEKAGIHGKPERVQSFLGGAFLRMYLDGKVDPDVVKQAGEEIGQSPELKVLVKDLEKYLQSEIDRHHKHKIVEAEIAKLSDVHLKAIKKHRGIAFKHNLNTVIGGVTDVAVNKVTAPLGGAPTAEPGIYTAEITFFDVYNFENKRSGEYDRFRKLLAHYLLIKDFDRFEDACLGQIAPSQFYPKVRKTNLDDAAVFASFMYALEKRQWTPGGFSWNVAVPVQVALRPAPQHTKSAKPHHTSH